MKQLQLKPLPPDLVGALETIARYAYSPTDGKELVGAYMNSRLPEGMEYVGRTAGNMLAAAVAGNAVREACRIQHNNRPLAEDDKEFIMPTEELEYPIQWMGPVERKDP